MQSEGLKPMNSLSSFLIQEEVSFELEFIG